MSDRVDPHLDETAARHGGGRHRPPFDRGHADEEWAEDERGWPENSQPAPANPRRRSWFARLAVRLIFLILILVVVAGGAFVADRMGWIDIPFFDRVAGGPGAAPPAQAESEVVFSGSAADLIAAEGNVIQEDTSVSPSAVWIRSSLKSASPAGLTDGVAVMIPESLLPRIEGRRIRVTVSARTGGQAEPAPFAIAYSAGDRGNSGWFVFTPTREIEDYDFAYSVPIGEIGDASNAHAIGIWSDISGNNAPLSIRQITIAPD